MVNCYLKTNPMSPLISILLLLRLSFTSVLLMLERQIWQSPVCQHFLFSIASICHFVLLPFLPVFVHNSVPQLFEMTVYEKWNLSFWLLLLLCVFLAPVRTICKNILRAELVHWIVASLHRPRLDVPYIWDRRIIRSIQAVICCTVFLGLLLFVFSKMAKCVAF